MHSDELARLPLHGQVAFSSNDNPPIDPTDHFWSPPLGNSTAAIPGQLHPTNATGSSNTVSTASSAFPMDLFYEQMGNGLSSLNEPQGSVQGQGQFGGGGQRLHPFSSNQQLENQAWMDSDTIAMWSNAPTGFE
jgi:hypothetical protein